MGNKQLTIEKFVLYINKYDDDTVKKKLRKYNGFKSPLSTNALFSDILRLEYAPYTIHRILTILTDIGYRPTINYLDDTTLSLDALRYVVEYNLCDYKRVHKKDAINKSYLHEAIDMGYNSRAMELMKHVDCNLNEGVEYHAYVKNMVTPLERAIKMQNYEVIWKLIECGANVNIKTGQDHILFLTIHNYTMFCKIYEHADHTTYDHSFLIIQLLSYGLVKEMEYVFSGVHFKIDLGEPLYMSTKANGEWTTLRDYVKFKPVNDFVNRRNNVLLSVGLLLPLVGIVNDY